MIKLLDDISASILINFLTQNEPLNKTRSSFAASEGDWKRSLIEIAINFVDPKTKMAKFVINNTALPLPIIKWKLFGDCVFNASQES